MNGTIPLDGFSDSGRQLKADFKNYYFTPEEFIDAPDDYPDFIPKWHNQDHYVQVWVEKDAMVGTFFSLLRDRDVGIMQNRGIVSWTALAGFRDRVVANVILGKKIHVLNYGDFDPTGDHQVDNFKSD